jgi:hypothetical protein
MKLIPLLDRAGQVQAWADRTTGWISDLNGNMIAFLSFDGVFRATANAEQIGWFGSRPGWWCNSAEQAASERALDSAVVSERLAVVIANHR